MTDQNIAEFLRVEGEALVAKWMSQVKADPRIKSDDHLSESGLRDHVPCVVQEIAELIEKYQKPHAGNIREGRVNAYTRFKQGYRCRDVVSELGILREILIDSILIPYIGVAVFPAQLLSAIRIVNQYIDEELRFAFALFSEALPTCSGFEQ